MGAGQDTHRHGAAADPGMDGAHSVQINRRQQAVSDLVETSSPGRGGALR